MPSGVDFLRMPGARAPGGKLGIEVSDLVVWLRLGLEANGGGLGNDPRAGGVDEILHK